MRQQPDIAFLADPQTGITLVESLFDAAGNPVAGPVYQPFYGGTSLSCPMFSALWAVANQSAGSPLGNAAPVLYGLPSGAIKDITPLDPGTSVAGTITTSSGSESLSSVLLSKPMTSNPFLSTFLLDGGSPYEWTVCSFGTDASQYTAKGWD